MTRKNQTNRQEVLESYKKAYKAYKENMTNENWIKFCSAKRTCMLLGVRI